ncbi:MAG: DUF2924 domain-containing protein [Sphingopyxis sp.]|nr:DUF2924 domain-containing protein [Sphingopyxis sp.]
MEPTTVREVEQLGLLDLEGLRDFWRGRFGAPPPLRSVELLRLMIAWRLQAALSGGLDQATRRALARTGAIAPEGSQLGQGAIITRDWQGKRHEVMVLDDGFRWEGKRFRSLSAVARAITGTRWNGPKFFGLREAEQ